MRPYTEYTIFPYQIVSLMVGLYFWYNATCVNYELYSWISYLKMEIFIMAWKFDIQTMKKILLMNKNFDFLEAFHPTMTTELF